MQTLHISRQELHTRGGVLDRMLDSLFDTAILVDTDCRILYISASSFPDPSQRQRWWGSISQCWTSLSPSRRCLRTRPTPARSLSGAPWPTLYLQPVSRPGRGAGHRRGGHHHGAQPGPVEKGALPAQRPGRRASGASTRSARVDSGYRLEDFVGESPPGGRPAGQGPEGRSQR